MTNNQHGQVPEALIDLIDAYAETRHRCGGVYNAKTEAARKAVIEDLREALSGVQALSAAPAGFVPVAAFDRLHAHAESLAARLLAAEQATPKAAPGEQLTREQIREVFMTHGFTIKEGQTDLKQYAYDAAYALLELVAAPPAEQQAATKAAPAWEHHARKLTRWLHCMSHNDSYFGEPAGLVKQVTGELNRLIGAAPQQEAQGPSKAYAWVYVNKYGVDSIPASKDWCATMVSGHGGSMFPLYTAPQPAPAPAPLSDEREDITNTQGAKLKTLPGPWSLGEMTGNWRDIDLPDHGAVMRIVWKMEDDEGRNEALEAQAHAVVAALNAASHTPMAGQQVIIDFAQVGTAGPFPVVNGHVKLPDATMQDLARMLRPTYEAEQQAAPKAAPGDALDEALRERDDAEDFIDATLDEVLGHERPEWSSSYGRADALNDVQERMTALHKPAVDKAWGRFQSAMAAPQQEPSRDAKTWCSYVAGMIGCYLKKPDESAEVRAIAGIIERRLWALPAHQPAPAPLIARSLAEWHEEDGYVAWWAWNGREWAGEPAWIGTPNCEDWPGYHTHWTPHPDQPVFSALAAQERQP